MQEAEAVRAIGAMAAAAPRILFSSSPTDLEESTHVNVKPVIWWLRRFAEVGMKPAADYDASFLTSHAYLLERSAEEPSAGESAAFAELVRQRMLAHDRAARLVGAEQGAAQSGAAAAEAECARQREAARAAVALAEAERARQQEAAATAVASTALAERARLEATAALAAKETAAAREAVQAMVAETERLRQHAAAASAVVAACIAEQTRLTAVSETEHVSASALEAELIAARASEAAARADESAARADESAARAERDTLLYSATWRATRPLRRVGQTLPVPARRAIRRLVRAGYWLGTLQFNRRMAERRAVRAALQVSLTAPKGASLAPASAPPEPPTDLLLEPARTDALLAPVPPETEYERWVREYDTLNDDDRVAIRAHIDRLGRKPLISVVMPAYETPEPLLRAAIGSVRAQLYPHWELCVADDASPSATVAQVLRDAAFAEPRIKWMRRESNGHIAAATNSAMSLASGEFVALMDHDDLLPEQALYEVAVDLDAHPETDLLYTDEDRIGPDGNRHSPYFKTDWNPDLLLGQNAVCHLGVYRRALLEKIGGLRSGFEGSQDYDLTLRVAAATKSARIRHVPAILYHWRERDQSSSFSQAQLEGCVEAARRAIADHLDSNGEGAASGEVLPAPAAPVWSRVRWPLPDPAPRASLIVPTRDRADLLARCAAGLLLRTDYPDLELLIADNDSVESATLALFDRLRADTRVRVLPLPGPFNFSALNNAAVRQASGQVLVLINNDIDVIDGGWLREMVSQAMRPAIGAVGAKLLYADDTVQHGGVLLGMGHFDGGPGVAGHVGLGASRDDVGYFGSLALTRDFSSVTGACLALRREVLEAVGVLGETNQPAAFNDVDL